MINTKSYFEIEIMKEAGAIVAKTHEEVKKAIKAGISTYEIDMIAKKCIERNGAVSACYNYYGFPGYTCTSINEIVVHGIPSKDVIVKDGDIISVDIAVIYKGYYADAAKTHAVGSISKENKDLLKVTKESFYKGLEFCKVGYRLGDVQHAIQNHIESNGYSVIKEFAGHGIGTSFHEEPSIPNYGIPNKGPRLTKGMTLAIEPMVSISCEYTDIQSDNWTAITLDRCNAAHYEHTVLITDGSPILLTKLD